MKHLLVLLSLCTVTACLPSGLSEVADKVPVQFTCGVNSDEYLTDLLQQFVQNPAKVEADLRKGFEADPAKTICILIDGERFLQRTGARATEAYRQVVDALVELEVL